MREVKSFFRWINKGLKEFEFKILSVLCVMVWVFGFYILLHGCIK